MNQSRLGSEPAGGAVAEADPGMDDAAFMDALDHGVLAPLSLYRRAYAAAGVPWPGDDEVRRRHQVTDEEATGDAPTSVQLMSWHDEE